MIPLSPISRALHDRDVELRELHALVPHPGKTGGCQRAAPPESAGCPARRSRQAGCREFQHDSDALQGKAPASALWWISGGQPFYLHQLSDGERGLLALVFDLTRRLAIANPESDNPIAEGVALVLIDEIELHLHPKWQRDVIERLRAFSESVNLSSRPIRLRCRVRSRPGACDCFLDAKDGKVVVRHPARSLRHGLQLGLAGPDGSGEQ